MIYKLEVKPNEDFKDVASRAKLMTLRQDIIVQFEFNEITCFIDFLTNLDWLYRDYVNAHNMNWEVIGTDCVETYSDEILAELADKGR